MARRRCDADTQKLNIYTRRPCCASIFARSFLSFLVRFDPALEIAECFFRTAGIRNFEFLAALLVVRDEERFDLRQQGLAHVGYGDEILVFVGMDRGAENPAVFLGFAILRLLGIDDANDPDCRSNSQHELARPLAP
jgi:hypothetical protein